MGIAGAETPSRTISWAGWLIRGVGLGLLGCALIWAAGTQLERARIEMRSTFEIQLWDLALAQLLYLLAGGVFALIVLLELRGSDSRSGLLVGGSLPPLVLMLVFFDGFGPGILASPLRSGIGWVFAPEAQTAAAMAFGVMVTTLIWQSVTGRRQGSDRDS